MVPLGQYSEHRLATMSPEDYEANWNGQADTQDHILSQADALTKNFSNTGADTEKVASMQALFADNCPG